MKLLKFALIFVVILACTIIPCFANVGGYGPNYVSMMVPEYIILYSHDDVIVANLTDYETLDNVTLQIDQYSLTIDSEPNLTTITANNFSFFECSFSYGEFYDYLHAGPVPATDIRYIFESNTQDLNTVTIDYVRYHYDTFGDYNEINDTFDYTLSAGQYMYDLNVINLVPDIADTHFRYGGIQYLDVAFQFETSQRSISFTSRSSADYGLTNGFNFPPSLTTTINQVNPNILEWLTKSVESFTTTEIFPNVTVGGLLLVFIAVPLCISFLKFFVGG